VVVVAGVVVAGDVVAGDVVAGDVVAGATVVDGGVVVLTDGVDSEPTTMTPESVAITSVHAPTRRHAHSVQAIPGTRTPPS
jgi:hypothetical protein